MKTERVLIVKLGAIGDVIMAIPAAWHLHLRGAEVAWVCGSTVKPLLECYSWIRPIVVDEGAVLHGSLVERIATIGALWTVVGVEKYDVCATLYYDKRYRFLSLPVRARRKIALSRRARAAMLIPGRHHTDDYHRLLLDGKDGYTPESEELIRPDHLPVSPWRPRRGKPTIALVPGGASNMLRKQILRRWPAQNYVAVAEALLSRGFEVVLLGGPEDLWVVEHFGKLSVSNLIGKLSLPEVISVCDECDVVISHDTGPLHLAGVSRAAVVGLFGPTDPANFLPRRRSVVGIWGGVGFGCRPCYDGRDFAACEFNGCMHQIIPDQVLDVVDRLVSSRAGGGDAEWRIEAAKTIKKLVDIM